MKWGLVAAAVVGVVALFATGVVSLPTNLLASEPAVELKLDEVRADVPRNYADGCYLAYEERKPRRDCVYGDPEGSTSAFLIGDSNAAQWLPALDAYAADQGWRLEVHTKAACSVADVPLWDARLQRTYDECSDWRESVMKRISRAAPEVVYVGGSRDFDLWSNGRIIRTGQARTYWQQKLTELLQRLDADANRVVLLAETPYLNFDPVDCLAEARRAVCDAPASLAVDGAYAALERAAADSAGASVLSVNAVLCPGRSCPAVVDDTVVFRDRHQLTASYMGRLAEPIGNLLEGRAPFPTPVPTATPIPSTTPVPTATPIPSATPIRVACPR